MVGRRRRRRGRCRARRRGESRKGRIGWWTMLGDCKRWGWKLMGRAGKGLPSPDPRRRSSGAWMCMLTCRRGWWLGWKWCRIGRWWGMSLCGWRGGAGLPRRRRGCRLRRAGTVASRSRSQCRKGTWRVGSRRCFGMQGMGLWWAGVWRGWWGSEGWRWWMTEDVPLA